MKNNKIFRLEEQFNYKGLNCYIGFHQLGHRIAGVEIPYNKANFTNILKLEISINCDYSDKNDENQYYIIENDFDHINNSYDIEGYKSIWGKDVDQERIEIMERRNKEELSMRSIVGSKELAEEKCRYLVNKCYNNNLIVE